MSPNSNRSYIIHLARMCVIGVLKQARMSPMSCVLNSFLVSHWHDFGERLVWKKTFLSNVAPGLAKARDDRITWAGVAGYNLDQKFKPWATCMILLDTTWSRWHERLSLVFEFAVGVRLLLSPPSFSQRFGGISADGVRSQIDGTTRGHCLGFNSSPHLEKNSWIHSCIRTVSNIFQHVPTMREVLMTCERQ